MLGGNASALILLGVLWISLFVLFRDLRREQLLTSVVSSSLFPVLHILTLEGTAITTPPFDHLVFLFLGGGLASVLYHIAFGQYYMRTPRHITFTHLGNQTWVWRWVALVFTASWIMILFGFVWPQLTMGWIFFLTALLFSVYYAVARKDLLFDAVMSAFLMLALFVMVDIVLISTASGTLAFDAYLQAAGLGLFFGPLYELARNLRLHHVSTRI